MGAADGDGGRRGPGDRSYAGMYDPLLAHHARFLNPPRATRRGGVDFDTTVYVADALLFRDGADGELIERFRTFLSESSVPVTAVVSRGDLASVGTRSGDRRSGRRPAGPGCGVRAHPP